MHLFAIPARECPADKGLALPVMVGPGRVDIIHAMVDGIPEQLRCVGFVDLPFRCLGMSHAAEPGDGEVRCFIVHFPVEPGWFTLSSGYGWDGG